MTEIKYKLISRQAPYGLGKDWSLILIKDGMSRTYWLGSDVKVMSRVLGMTLNDGLNHYKRKANSTNPEVIYQLIASDILRNKLKTGKLTQEKLEELWLKNQWSLSV